MASYCNDQTHLHLILELDKRDAVLARNVPHFLEPRVSARERASNRVVIPRQSKGIAKWGQDARCGQVGCGALLEQHLQGHLRKLSRQALAEKNLVGLRHNFLDHSHWLGHILAARGSISDGQEQSPPRCGGLGDTHRHTRAELVSPLLVDRCQRQPRPSRPFRPLAPAASALAAPRQLFFSASSLLRPWCLKVRASKLKGKSIVRTLSRD